MSGKAAKKKRIEERELILINIAGMALAAEVSTKNRLKGIIGLLVNKGIISLRNYQPSEDLLHDQESDKPGGIPQTQSGGDQETSKKE